MQADPQTRKPLLEPWDDFETVGMVCSPSRYNYIHLKRMEYCKAPQLRSNYDLFSE